MGPVYSSSIRHLFAFQSASNVTINWLQFMSNFISPDWRYFKVESTWKLRKDLFKLEIENIQNKMTCQLTVVKKMLAWCQIIFKNFICIKFNIVLQVRTSISLLRILSVASRRISLSDHISFLLYLRLVVCQCLR